MKQKINGIQLNVRDEGRGEPSLLFLHYWGGSSRTWDLIINRLKPDFRCVAYDHRGWGESEKPETGYSSIRSDTTVLYLPFRVRTPASVAAIANFVCKMKRLSPTTL